mmetsp:Transcript_62381/g.115791  ORF Transcript_62381/g.115791 Transcript_62381/m.115791 type:complete len:299 (-) Transcript_62381:108-1004(-)
MPSSKEFKNLPDEKRNFAIGAELDEHGRLEYGKYKDLAKYFADDQDRSLHPDINLPGVNTSELESVRAMGATLCWWSDPRGNGWIARADKPPVGKRCPAQCWFTVATWGSWRLAFVLARLQREVWVRNSEPHLRPTHKVINPDSLAALVLQPQEKSSSSRNAGTKHNEDKKRERQKEQDKADRMSADIDRALAAQQESSEPAQRQGSSSGALRAGIAPPLLASSVEQEKDRALRLNMQVMQPLAPALVPTDVRKRPAEAPLAAEVAQKQRVFERRERTETRVEEALEALHLALLSDVD